MSKPNIVRNVVIENPKTRETINNILSIVGPVLGTLMVVDLASSDFDLTRVTEPFFIGYAYLASAFGLAVTRPNYPQFPR